MTSRPPTASARVQRLQTRGGHYAMLALDQRESMRGMFAVDADGVAVADRVLREFKQAGVEILSPHASAVLLDRPYGLTGSRPTGVADSCGLIVAVDVLHQVAGQPITDVSFDELVTVDLLHAVGADAIKLLLLWDAGSGQQQRSTLLQRTVDLAAVAGVASLVEGIVRPVPGTSWASPAERHEAILSCAAELTAVRPDIYKAEVPGYLPGDVSLVREHSERMTEIVGGDWVVLSNGVEREMFAAAVTEACRGGARGFLAGRAIWADTVNEPDFWAALSATSVDRLTRLTEIVDGASTTATTGQPW